MPIAFRCSQFYAELLGSSSATMRSTPSTQGRATAKEHRGSERTVGLIHLQRPPWMDTFDDPHQHNGINGHSRLLSGTKTPLPSPVKSTIRVLPGTLSKEKSRDVSFPDSPATVHTVDGMGLFKTADGELDVEESNIESRLGNLSSRTWMSLWTRTQRRRPLSQVRYGNCMSLFTYHTRD